jgi:hemerythrin-like domain-containing protein
MVQVIQAEIMIEQNERILALLEVLKKVGISEANNQTNVLRDMAQNWADFLQYHKR